MIPIYPIGYPDSINPNENHEVIFAPLDGDPQPRLKRTGYCSRCGNCCDDNENIFAEVDGNNEPNPLVQVVPGKCAYFRVMEDGLSGCAGRDTLYYKNGCNISPSHPGMMADWPDCTYVFEVLDGN